MASKFHSSKQCRVRIFKLGSNNTVTVQLAVSILVAYGDPSTYLVFITCTKRLVHATEKNPVLPTFLFIADIVQILQTNRS